MTPEEHTTDEDAAAEPADDENAYREHVYRVAVLLAVLLVGAATAVYKYGEGWSWVDSLYFSVVAVTTVGFGDLTPSTDGTKLFTVFYVLAGISLIGLVLDERLRRQAARRGARRRR